MPGRFMRGSLVFLGRIGKGVAVGYTLDTFEFRIEWIFGRDGTFGGLDVGFFGN